MFIKREQYLAKLRQLKDKNLIKVITGIRRSGKSTIFELFQNELRNSGISQDRIQSLNFESVELASESYQSIYAKITSSLVADQTNYIFLDEIQMLPEFERLIDGLFILKNVDLYVTGSNAYLLSGELATLLTGRYFPIHVLPLSFAEYSEFFAGNDNAKLFARYLSSTTFPEALNLSADAPELVSEYVETVYQNIVSKDIFVRYDVRDDANFERVFRFILGNIGSFVSTKSIADALNVGKKATETTTSHNTVARYLGYFVESYLLYKADRYDIKGKELLKTQDKYYVVDLGLRLALLGEQKDVDLGHKLENIVYLELVRRYGTSIYVGKHKDQEVDFVVNLQEGGRLYFQVAWTVHDSQTLKRELKPLESIKDNYQKFVITTDPDNSLYEGIQKLNVVDWLLSSK